MDWRSRQRQCWSPGPMAAVPARWDIWQLPATLGEHLRGAHLFISGECFLPSIAPSLIQNSQYYNVSLILRSFITVGHVLHDRRRWPGLADHIFLGLFAVHEVDARLSHLRLDADYFRCVHRCWPVLETTDIGGSLRIVIEILASALVTSRGAIFQNSTRLVFSFELQLLLFRSAFVTYLAII